VRLERRLAAGVVCGPLQRVLPATEFFRLLCITLIFLDRWRLAAGVRFLSVLHTEVAMIAFLGITILTAATLFALGVAACLHWVLLRVSFWMMRPATARRVVQRTELTRGTALLTRAFVGHR